MNTKYETKQRIPSRLVSCLAMAMLLIFQATSLGAYQIPGDDVIGTWDSVNRVYTLSQNLFLTVDEKLDIVQDNVTLDGAGFRVTGPGYDPQNPNNSTGVDVYMRANVTVKNLIVQDCQSGVRVYYSSNITVKNNELDNNNIGINIFNSSGNTVQDNTCSRSEIGIYLYGSGDTSYSCSDNTLTGNTFSDNAKGIFLNRHPNATDNEVYNNRLYYNNIVANSLGIYLVNVNNNQIYNNNVINSSSQQVQVTGGSGNVFDLGESVGGNFWSDYTGVDDGSNGRTAGDGIGDTLLPHLGVDNYPFMAQNGWPTYTDEGSDVSVSDAESGVTVTFDNVDGAGITTCEMTDGGPPPPSGFRLLPVGIYYEINTTATYTGDITICINYDDSGMTEGQEGALKLKHFDETLGQWVDITDPDEPPDNPNPDTVNNVICGTVSSLSTFGVFVPINQPPVASCQNVTVEAGPSCEAEAFIDAGSYDPDGDLITIVQNPAGPYPLGETLVTLTVTDAHGASDTCTATVTVTDVSDPVLTSLTPDWQVVPLGSPANFTIVATDNCSCAGTVWEFDVDNPLPEQFGNCDSMSYLYTGPGIYSVGVVAVDDAENMSDPAFANVVVYDPSGGFVTGGGWIWSPQRDLPYMNVEGKANFGFVSKYKKGATEPTGQTEFVFQAGDLNFHSSSYDWLVVNQNDSNAQFKGSGTINGEGDYKFMLWAGDNDPDTFRIKIWEENGGEVVVYDNGSQQPIGGGSIVVHAG